MVTGGYNRFTAVIGCYRGLHYRLQVVTGGYRWLQGVTGGYTVVRVSGKVLGSNLSQVLDSFVDKGFNTFFIHV